MTNDLCVAFFCVFSNSSRTYVRTYLQHRLDMALNVLRVCVCLGSFLISSCLLYGSESTPLRAVCYAGFFFYRMLVIFWGKVSAGATTHGAWGCGVGQAFFSFMTVVLYRRCGYGAAAAANFCYFFVFVGGSRNTHDCMI